MVFIKMLDGGVALAGSLLECRAVEDLDVTTPVANEASALRQARRDSHGGSAHAEHLPKKFLRQRDDVAVGAIVRLQQPAAKSRFQLMQRIARHRLLDLRQQQIVVAHDQVADGLALHGSGMEVGGREPRGARVTTE
jgi:hypothetical protein